MPWYRGPDGGLEWLQQGARVPQGYNLVQGATQAPTGEDIGSQFKGNTSDLLAKYGIQPPSQSPQSTQIAQVQPVATGSPVNQNQATQAAPVIQNSAAAALAALKAARANSSLGGTDATPVDNLISMLERGQALGMDNDTIIQASQAGIDSINQWQDTDALKVLRGELSGENRRGQLLESIGKTQQGLSLPVQAAQEKRDITSEADKQATAREALRKETLAKIPGLQEQLGNDLLQQQNYAYAKILPQIEQRLNAMGILQSGALPEAQTKAFADLENARQARLSDFGTSATQNTELNLPYASLLQSQSDKQGALQSGIDLARAGISRQFQESDLAKVYGQQNDLSRLALEEARRAREQANKTALWQAGIGGFGNILAGAASRPKGA